MTAVPRYALGAALVAALAAWTAISAERSGGDPGPTLALIAATAAAFAAARIVAAKAPGVVPIAVVAVGAAVVILWWEDVLSGKPAGEPFGYANATAALLTQSSIAAMMIAVGGGRGKRWAGGAMWLAFAFVALAAGATAASAVAILLPPAALAAARSFEPRKLVVAGAVGLTVAAVCAPVLLGLGYGRDPEAAMRSGWIEPALGWRRPALWYDALAIMSAEPLLGVGAGRFEEASPIAASDRDARWAHNDFLEYGAESGLPGLALLLASVAWLVWTTVPGGGSPDRQALGAAAIVALVALASIDYVLHFAVVPVAGAALAGAAPAGRGEWGSRRSSRSS